MNTIYFTTGIYMVRDAARLTGVSTGRIRRWLRGYRYRSRKKAYASPPLWQGQWKPIDHNLALGFLDLIEIRFVDAFLKAGVSWATLRQARERAEEMFGVSPIFMRNSERTRRTRTGFVRWDAKAIGLSFQVITELAKAPTNGGPGMRAD